MWPWVVSDSRSVLPAGRVTVGPLRKPKLRRVARVWFQMLLTMTGFNLIRMRGLVGG